MECDVVVAGGGPVGLMLAGELRLGGASVVVLERETEPPPTRFGSMGARAVNAPTVHALRLRGLLGAVAEAALWWLDPASLEQPPPDQPHADQPRAEQPQADGLRAGQPEDGPAALFGRLVRGGQAEPAARPEVFVGHFAGIDIRADRLKPTGEEFAGAGVIAQGDLEGILSEWAIGLGARVRRGVAVTGFDADEDGVSVRTGDGEVRARWLVGADGGRSAVRKLAGFDFVGVDPVFTGRQAVVDLAQPHSLVAGGWQPGENGSYTVGGWADGQGPPRVHTVEYTPSPERDSPVTADEMQESLRRVSGTEVTVTAVHAATRYTDTTRQASTYRLGRVLLCGDAAHVHSPAGGQGMNLGLGDAVNLGWKLALVARRAAPDQLLDTYTAERHPIGEWVQRWSMAQTALSAGRGPRAEALRTVLTEVLDTPDAATYVVSMIGGGWQRYGHPGDHPLVGTRVPDLALDDGSILAQHGRTGRAVLLDSGLGVTAPGWADRVTRVAARLVDVPDPLAAVLRPDGHLAWLATDPPDPDVLPAVLETWFGPPAGP